jgi:NADH oxidase (H2O2-forming)
LESVADGDPQEHVCTLEESGKVVYEKLVLATGSRPVRPKWLKGADLDQVFTIPKNKEYLDKMLNEINPAKQITVVGAGFIGVEISDELNKRGINITLVEIEPTILSKAFDR